MKIKHPKALIRHRLQEAGVPTADLHDLTEGIAEAYDDANTPGLAQPIDMPPSFGVIAPGWPGPFPHDEPEDGGTP